MARYKRREIIVSLFVLVTLGLSLSLPEAHAWVSARSKHKKGPVYGIPFVPRWVSVVKKGGIIKYKRREFSGPVVAGDQVFVGADSGYLYAMKLKNGSKQWRFKAEGPVNSTPAVGGGKVFFGDDDGRLYALDTVTGEQVWIQKYRSPVMAPPLPVGQRLYFVTLTGTIFAVDIETGESLWSYPSEIRSQEMTLYGHSAPAYDSVGRGEGRVYVGLSDGRLLALAASSGHLIWSKNLSQGVPRFNDIDMQPLINGDRLYVATFSGHLFCLKKQNGESIWQVAIGSGVGFALSGETLYVSGTDGILHAINKMTGAEIWKRDLSPGALSRPVIYGNLIAVASTEQSILFVDARNGYKVMQRFARKNISSDLILTGEKGNLLVYLSNAGRLYALKLKDTFRKN